MGAVIKTITKGADKLFEEVIEKPGKKIIQETKCLTPSFITRSKNNYVRHFLKYFGIQFEAYYVMSDTN